MFNFKIPVARLFGVTAYLHWSWVLFFLLFSIVFGPAFSLVYIGVFSIVLLHEFGHCVTAKKYNVPVYDIVLLPIGGAARIDFVSCPKKEFFITLAGPAVNVALIVPLMFLSSLHSYFQVLQNVNIALIVFNMIPAFPMDGGRIFRASLSYWLKDHLKATVIAGRTGQVICICFCIYGMTVGNIMLVLIGIFISMMAGAEIDLARIDRARSKRIRLNFESLENLTDREDEFEYRELTGQKYTR